MKLAYRYFLFDWDGCLAQSLEAWLGAFKQALADFDLFPDDRSIAQQFGVDGGGMALGVPEIHYEVFLGRLSGFVDERLADVELYPGAVELLQALHDNTDGGLALVTSSPSKHLENVLERVRLASYFDVIVASEDVQHCKPHPEAIEVALAKLNAAKAEAIVIGDSEKDLRAANNAGVDSVLVHFPSHAKFHDLEELRTHSPTYVCHSLDELWNILYVAKPNVSVSAE